MIVARWLDPWKQRSRRDESGAMLILALIFIVAVAVSTVGLLNLTGDDLKNSGNLRFQRGLEYAADSAVTAAVENVRFSPNAYYPPTSGSSCLPAGMGPYVKDPQGVPFEVDCEWAGSGTPVIGEPRVIQFFACTASACDSSNSVVRAQVTFYDAATDGSIAFGSGMTIVSWLFAGAD